MGTKARPLAIVTGASSGIGFELAKICAKEGFNLVVVADEPEIEGAAEELRKHGVSVEALNADLAKTEEVDRLVALVSERPVDALIANAGRGLGKGFLDQEWGQIRRVIDTNVTGTLYLIQQVGRAMRARRQGRILIVGSIAGFMPGTFQAVYNGTKALLDSFSMALRAELADTGISVTCLMPGPTETEFFERADMLDTRVGTAHKQEPAQVAKVGFEAMMHGTGQVVSGWQNKLQAAIAHVAPAAVLAQAHRKQAAPGTAKR